jgi:FkbM family methyltransferase
VTIDGAVEQGGRHVAGFSPIDISDAGFYRRLLFRIIPLIGSLSRWIWRLDAASRSSWPEQTALWQTIWKLNRNLGYLPRAHSYEIDTKMGKWIHMKIDLARLPDVLAFCFGLGESEVGYACSLFCSAKSTIIDVGANIGSTTLAFAEMVPLGHVLAFEPSSEMQRVLKANVALCQFKNITVYPFGLSDEPMQGQLHVAMAGNPGSAYVTPWNSGTDRDRIELHTLDETIDEKQQVDVIKIDVEGFEYRVLRGGERLIKSARPVLVLEINKDALTRAGTNSQDLFRLLDDWGYRLFYLHQGGLVQYVPDAHSNSGLHNIVAVHPGSEKSWRILQAHEKTIGN